MPIFAKSSGVWYQGNNPTSNLIFAKQGGYWYTAAFIYAKWGGAWYGTGYVGKPGMPQNQQIVSAADNFNQIAVGYWGPPDGGPVSYYIVRMYDQNGTYVGENRSDSQGNQPGLHYFGVKPDNRYQFRVFAVNSAGEGPGTPALRYATGHPQQTRQDPVYGWGGEYDWGVNAVDASTEIAGRERGYCADWGSNPQGCFTTSWLSGSRAAASRAEAVRLQPRAGIGDPNNARLASVRVWPVAGQRLFIGLYTPAMGWRGGTNYLTDLNLWYNSNPTFAHDYCRLQGGLAMNSEYAYRPVDEGMDLRASQVLVDCALDTLDFISGGYRGGFAEIILRFQNWQVVSYATVVTVSQQNNYYW